MLLKAQINRDNRFSLQQVELKTLFCSRLLCTLCDFHDGIRISMRSLSLSFATRLRLMIETREK